MENLLANVIDALTNDRFDVIVSQGVENGLTLPAGLHQTHIFQCPQLVGNGGLGHIQQLGDVAHAHLFLKQHIENADPGGVSENAEQFRQIVQGILPRHLLTHTIYNALVDVDKVAAFHVIAILHEYLHKTND